MIGKRIISIAAVGVGLLAAPSIEAQDYNEALHLTTKFFGAQRCGSTDSWIHGACHGGDANISASGETVDLSGGWHDCGDHVKFGQTNAYAAALLLHSYLNYSGSFPDDYSQAYSSGSSNGVPDVLDEVKIYTDYALKILVGNRLYYQVGSADIDHLSCSDPVYQTNSEPWMGGKRDAFWVEDGGATNIAGINAAVLAMMSEAYRDIDGSYASKCLSMAKKLYDFGDKSHYTQNSLNSSWEEDDTYTDDSWADELAFAAGQLYRATKEDKYRDAMHNIMSKVEFHCPTSWVLDYPVVSPLAVYDYITLLNSKATEKVDSLRKEVDAYLSHELFDGKLALFGNGNGTVWGSSKYASAASYVSLLYYNLTQESKYKSFAKKNIDFLLGDHSSLGDAPSGYSFVCDYGSNSANEQIGHSAAAGLQGTNWDTWNNNHSTYNNPKTLTGALVGGVADVTEDGSLNSVYFVDNRNDYYTMEVCIYYNAPFVASLGALLFMENGVPNSDPFDLRLNNSQVAAKKPEGTTVGSFITVDRDLDDTHSYTLKSGGSNFTISGNVLKTKVSLDQGTYDITVEVSDGNGGKLTRDFTIRVVKGDIKNNAIHELGWYAYTNGYGSTFKGEEGDSVVKHDDVFVDWDIIKEVPEDTIWPGGTLTFVDTIRIKDNKFDYKNGKRTSFKDVDYIVMAYKSDNDYKMTLPLPGTKNDEYFKALPSTGGAVRVDTIYLDSGSSFNQEGWGTEVGFDRSKMYKFAIITDFNDDQGTFGIEAVVFDGWEAPVVSVINTVPTNAMTKPLFKSVAGGSLALSVPAADDYLVTLYSVDGRILYQNKANLTAGVHALDFGSSQISTGLLLAEIKGSKGSFIQKLMIK